MKHEMSYRIGGGTGVMGTPPLDATHPRIPILDGDMTSQCVAIRCGSRIFVSG